MDERLKKLLQEPANKTCSDCGDRNPRFASTTFGVFLCSRCFGVHRSLGTHVTKTRSVSLDKWTEEHINSMKRHGNAVAAQIWESSLEIEERPAPDCDDWTREDFIRNKYVRRKWYSEPAARKLRLEMTSDHACTGQSTAQTMTSSASCIPDNLQVKLPSCEREIPCHAGVTGWEITYSMSGAGPGENMRHRRADEDPFGLDSLIMAGSNQTENPRKPARSQTEPQTLWDPFSSLSSTPGLAGTGNCFLPENANVKNAFDELDMLFGPAAAAPNDA